MSKVRILRVVFIVIFGCSPPADCRIEPCGCSISIIGPYQTDRVMLLCNSYSYGINQHKRIKYSWRLLNISSSNPVAPYYSTQHHNNEVSDQRYAKITLEASSKTAYACIASRPDQEMERCEVILTTASPETSNKFGSIILEPSFGCLEQGQPLSFSPWPKLGVVKLDPGVDQLIKCAGGNFRAPSLEDFFITIGPEPQGSQDFSSVENDVFHTYNNSSEEDLNLTEVLNEVEVVPDWGPDNRSYVVSSRGQQCVSHLSRQKNTAILRFPVFNNSCAGLYTCVAGPPGQPLKLASVLIVVKKEREDEDWPNLQGDGHHGGDRDDHKDVMAGVGGLVALVGLAAAVALVWRRRLMPYRRDHTKRRASSSKVPLFINKAYSKGVVSELEEFPRKHIRFLQHIGKGTFGTVVMAETYKLQKHKGGGSSPWEIVAIKMTLISEKSNEQLKNNFLSEVALMKSIPPHTNIISLYASCTAHDPYLMILEFAQHGDLRKFLQENRMERNYANAAYSAYGVGRKRTDNYYCNTSHVYTNQPNSEHKSPKENCYTNLPTNECDLITSRDLLSFALQVSKGLDHLAQNKIVHRDVAARNVLVCEHKLVKISDFGLARKLGQEDVYERTTKGLLPIRWMSPESLFYNQYSEKSDVWSYGVLLWELITLGSTPYPGLDSSTILEKIKNREMLVCPPHASSTINQMVSDCWREEPQSRPTFSQLGRQIEELLESQVEYLDLDQIIDHEYSTLD